MLFTFSVIICSLSALAQGNISVSGTVTEESGEPLPGVNIIVKGTTNGVATDIDGKYTVSVPGRTSVLEFSYLGFAMQSVTVGNLTVINITMREDAQMIEEVVVVGYGTQKKVNLTGAVSAMTVDETLTSRSLVDVSSGLQGMLPGLAVSQNSSMAGREDVTLMIRGMGTVNNAAPLIVVDGMPDVNINRLNMNDIESISVLKDAASAAIYGSRAANGVILITTKSGKGSERVAFNVSGNYSTSYPTNSIEFMPDYARALTIHQRTAAVNTLESNYQFKNGTIDQWLAMSMIDPVKFPNTDWWEWIMRNHGTMQNYNVSASGSNDKSNFFASLGIQDQEGLQINNDYSRYNARFNFDYKLLNSLSVGVRFSGNWTNRTFYMSGGYTDTDNQGNTGGYDLQYAIAGITPYDPETGYYGGVMAYGEDAQAYNPYTYMVNNLNYNNRQEALGNMFLDWQPLKGLTAHLEYALNYYNQFQYAANTPNRAYNFQAGAYGSRVYVGEDAGVSNATSTGYKTQLNGRLNYNLTVADGHNISLMAAYSEELWYNRSQSTSRNNRLHPSLHEVDAALTDVQGTGGNSNTEGLRSYIGRLNYAACDKYLLEINFRADGSSRFLPGHQYGFFPSVSLGWRFSEENFVKNISDSWLYQGKLRASYGTLGNNDVSRYEQKETLTASNYMMGSTIVKGFVNKKMINQDLTWETGQVANLGLDMSFLKGKLSTELDFYDRLTTGMIRPSQMSLHLTGAYSAPRDNIGDMRNRGVEINLTWKDRNGDFTYMVNGNFSKNWTKLELWNEFLDKGWTYVNMPYHFVYTYEDYGIAQTWNDIYSHTPQGASPGDILRKDVNGDGRIDGNDKVAYPEYLRDRPTTNFALNGNARWKDIDVAIMLQGAAGRKTFWINNYNNVNPNAQRYASSWEHWNNPWSWENRDAEWPRLGGNSNREEMTFWLDNLSYLRLKNLQLGYSLPQKWLKAVYVSSMRIYFSGENLATLTKFRGIDPERGGRGDSGGYVSDVYPLVSSYSLGFNIGF
ncbi:MAG: TonB-dependent receptor [Tannerella sp.]|jgi:TonB-linked SusC/RagA family outer membrane protein|nr:TonB-dependent receptor [Tannerella sp.]